MANHYPKDTGRRIHDHTRTPQLTFFALVLGLSVPFWLLFASNNAQLMPGLSVGVLMAFCPMLAAWLLVYREKKAEGVTGCLASASRCTG